MSETYYHKERARQEAWHIFHALNDCEWNPGEDDKDGIKAHAVSLLYHINSGAVPENMLKALSKAVNALAHGEVPYNMRYCLGWLQNRLA